MSKIFMQIREADGVLFRPCRGLNTSRVKNQLLNLNLIERIEFDSHHENETVKGYPLDEWDSSEEEREALALHSIKLHVRNYDAPDCYELLFSKKGLTEYQRYRQVILSSMIDDSGF